MASAGADQGKRLNEVLDFIGNLEPDDAARADPRAFEGGQLRFDAASKLSVGEGPIVRYDGDLVGVGL